MKTPIRTLLAITTLTLAAMACQALGSRDSTEDPATTEESTSPESAQPNTNTDLPSLAPGVTSKGVGFVCAGLRAGGISCLTESGWQTYTEENSDLPSNYVDAGTTCPDGRIAIAHYDGVSLFNGQTWENINSGGNYTSVYGLACTTNNEIWVAHYQGISHHANGTWATHPATDLASGDSANDLVYGVAAASDGTIWAVTSRSVASYNGSAWTVYQQGSGFNDMVFFNSIAIDSLNRPWVGASDGAYVFENGTWAKVSKNDYDSPQAMTIDTKGQVWLATITNGASVFNGNSWNTYNTATQNMSSDQVNSIAADTLGRVWLGTTYGLTVFDGTNWQTVRMDNATLGDNYIEFVAISNDGPSLPALTEQPVSGLTGSLNNASNQPMAGMRVEICVEPLASTFDGDTPCTGQPFLLSTTTDASGVFNFSNVPAGYYVIVAETGTDSWAQLTDEFGIGSERTLLPAGEIYDIGPLTLEE